MSPHLQTQGCRPNPNKVHLHLIMPLGCPRSQRSCRYATGHLPWGGQLRLPSAWPPGWAGVGPAHGHLPVVSVAVGSDFRSEACVGGCFLSLPLMTLPGPSPMFPGQVSLPGLSFRWLQVAVAVRWAGHLTGAGVPHRCPRLASCLVSHGGVQAPSGTLRKHGSQGGAPVG